MDSAYSRRTIIVRVIIFTLFFLTACDQWQNNVNTAKNVAMTAPTQAEIAVSLDQLNQQLGVNAMLQEAIRMVSPQLQQPFANHNAKTPSVSLTEQQQIETQIKKLQQLKQEISDFQAKRFGELIPTNHIPAMVAFLQTPAGRLFIKNILQVQKETRDFSKQLVQHTVKTFTETTTSAPNNKEPSHAN